MVGIIVIFILVMGETFELVRSCDPSNKIITKEGNMGQTAEFSWLGILRVHLHYERELKIAITGIILVKTGFALVNAHDVVRIPKRTFREDSEAMFIAAESKPCRYQLKDYYAHPEYDYSTVNTLAVIELEPPEDHSYSIVPICWPPRGFKSTGDIYAVGYTDENMLLEKSIYRLQSVADEDCHDFYNRAGLSEGLTAPLYFRCGFAVNNHKNCVWDNGMALLTNSTGYWTLLGFSIQGPGCAAPARFVDLQVYLPWVESVTSVKEIEGRRQGWIRKSIHDLFRISTPSVKPPYGQYSDKYYPFLAYDDPFQFDIQRINQSAILIQKLEDPIYYGTPVKYGDCLRTHPLIYHDDISIKYDYNPLLSMVNTAIYKISLFDLSYMNYSCVSLNVVSGHPREAYIYFKRDMEVKHAFIDTPEDLLLHYPIRDVGWNGSGPHPQMRPHTLTALWHTIRNITNVNVYVKVQFVGSAQLQLYVFGEKRARPARTRSRVLRSTTTVSSTTDPYSNRRRAAPPMPYNQRPLSNLYFSSLYANSSNCLSYVFCLFVTISVMLLLSK